MAFVKIILLPLSVIYGVVTGVRNFLFHIGVLKSQTFRVPVICVGNITVGGTGKTPHTELIISELKKKFRVACLSRGYKRKTRGFILANEHSTAAEIGDEPMQIKSKYPDILVACDGNRVRGIQKLLALPEPPEVILLDDAFQHRYVQADKNIVLIDYNRPVHEDCLLPAGRLRESVQALKRADYIIVTKCPKSIQPIEKRILSEHLKIKPYQQLFFTTLEYGKIKPLFPQYESIVPDRSSSILCLTGIAQPGPYIDHLKTFTGYHRNPVSGSSSFLQKRFSADCPGFRIHRKSEEIYIHHRKRCGAAESLSLTRRIAKGDLLYSGGTRIYRPRRFTIKRNIRIC